MYDQRVIHNFNHERRSHLPYDECTVGLQIVECNRSQVMHFTQDETALFKNQVFHRDNKSDDSALQSTRTRKLPYYSQTILLRQYPV